MICRYCGSQVEKGRPCPNCGAMQHIGDPAESRPPEQQAAQQGFLCDENGAYHWEYRMSAFSNPSVLRYLLRFVFLFGVFIALVQLMLWAGDGCTGDITGTLLYVAGCTGGLLAFCAVLWVVLMLLKGPRLIARYTMNENEISYVTDPERSERWKQKHPYQPIYDEQTLTKWQRPVSVYAKVRKIKTDRRKNLIRVDVFMQKSMVFVPPEQYDFVCAYITSRCPHAKIK